MGRRSRCSSSSPASLLALGVGLVFPLPPIDLHGRFRPVQGAQLLGRLLVDAFRASVDVVALAFRFGTVPRSSIVRVQLRSRSDLYLTQTAELVSLVPGTIVAGGRTGPPAPSTCTSSGATDDAAIDDRRARRCSTAEARVLRTFGSAAEVAALDAGPAAARTHHVDARGGLMVDMVVMVMVSAGALMLAVAAVLTVARMSRGPSSLDRVVAADVLIAVVIAALALEAIVNDHSTTLPVMLVLSLLGFAGSVSIARFVADRDKATRWDVESQQPRPARGPGTGRGSA